MRKLIVIILIVAGLSACRSQRSKSPVISSNQDRTELVLEEGQNLFLEKEQVNLSFVRVLEDSRCPKGVQCFWAGVGAIELTVMGTYTRPQAMLLATENIMDKNYAKSIVFNGYTYRLVSLLPYPVKDKPKSDSEKYRVRLLIER